MDRNAFQNRPFVRQALRLSLAAGLFLSRIFGGNKLQLAEKEAASTKDMALREAETIKKEAELQAKDTMLKLRQEFEVESKQRREELLVSEKRITQKEENVEKRLDFLDKKEKDLGLRTDGLKQKELDVTAKNEELAKLVVQEKEALHKISTLSREEAKVVLLSRIETELVHEKATRIRQMEEEIKDSADKKSRELLSLYKALCTKLRGDGVVSVAFAVSQTPTAVGIGRGVAQLPTDSSQGRQGGDQDMDD